MAARLLGIVTMALSAASASVLIGQLTKPGDKSSKFESNEGHLTAAGYVLAQLLMGMPGLALSCMSISSRRSYDKLCQKDVSVTLRSGSHSTNCSTLFIIHATERR